MGIEIAGLLGAFIAGFVVIAGKPNNLSNREKQYENRAKKNGKNRNNDASFQVIQSQAMATTFFIDRIERLEIGMTTMESELKTEIQKLKEANDVLHKENITLKLNDTRQQKTIDWLRKQLSTLGMEISTEEIDKISEENDATS